MTICHESGSLLVDDIGVSTLYSEDSTIHLLKLVAIFPIRIPQESVLDPPL